MIGGPLCGQYHTRPIYCASCVENLVARAEKAEKALAAKERDMAALAEEHKRVLAVLARNGIADP